MEKDLGELAVKQNEMDLQNYETLKEFFEQQQDVNTIYYFAGVMGALLNSYI